MSGDACAMITIITAVLAIAAVLCWAELLQTVRTKGWPTLKPEREAEKCQTPGCKSYATICRSCAREISKGAP